MPQNIRSTEIVVPTTISGSRTHQCMLNMKPHIIALKKGDKLVKPVIILIGCILSIWSNVIFLVGCDPRGYTYSGSETWLAACGFLTHTIISLAAAKGLYYGVNNNDPVFLKPWLLLKIVEGIILFTGSVLCAGSYRYVGLAPVGIILLLGGLYVTLCVYTTYKQMMIPPVPPPSDGSEIPQHPPAYDSFTNQKNMA